jgi:S1-C subfamily serine protease
MRSLYLLLIVLGLALFATMLIGCKPLESREPIVRIEGMATTGTGVHIGNGIILTAAHVVSEFPKRFTVIDDRGVVRQNSTVLWVAPEYDIALMKVAFTEGWATANLECGEPELGSPIVAEGYAFGAEMFRSIGTVGTATPQSLGPWKAIAIADSSFAPGMSGGPVWDAARNLIGIAVGVRAYQMSLTGLGTYVPGATLCELLGRA